MYSSNKKISGNYISTYTNSVPKNITTVFQNGPNYNYHLIKNELAEEFEKQFNCLWENTEKYITFTVPIEKEVRRMDKNGEEVTKVYLTFYSLLIAQDLW